MKIKIYFNYCIEGTINLACASITTKNTFSIDIKKNILYLYSKKGYTTLKNVSKYVNSIEFCDIPSYSINFGGDILGIIPKNTDCLEFVLNTIKKEED